ncbi:uncharacterized protein LOC118195583, partial [Stegodyphus dumicola]|uniref:uncharacterized protein LOC118195583 n=1 Tax=Stegodyphus dumicola TaxID=202533 RepID=UPI0015A8217A
LSKNPLPTELPEKRKFKLPKIELKKFNGEAKEFLTFWSQFSKIHEDPTIPDEDKFQYLLQAVVPQSKAARVVESFPATASNYPKAIAQLRERFGREDLLVQIYVRDLLSMVMRNASSGRVKTDLPTLYDDLETKIRALESLGRTQEKYGDFLTPLVESCLPEEVLIAWERNRNLKEAPQPDDRCLENLMNFLKQEVKGEEMVVLARTGFDETFSFQIEALSESKICGTVPKVNDSKIINELKDRGVSLSDLGSSDREIDLLLGADIVGALFTNKSVRLESGLFLIDTCLGHVLTGKHESFGDSNDDTVLNAISLYVSNYSIKDLWSLESIDGRYELCLPFKSDVADLPTNKDLTWKRHKRMCQRAQDKAFLEEYTTIFREWEKLNIIEKVTDNIETGHFLPHRPVIKDSTTTKIRPVFDASARESDVTDIDTVDTNHLRKRIRFRAKLMEDLRVRFRKEYLGLLIQKRQQNSHFPNIRVNDVVLIGDDIKKRLNWPLARVTELIPGKDGKVRTVRLRTQTNNLVRPIQRVFPLEIQDDDLSGSCHPSDPQKHQSAVKSSDSHRGDDMSTSHHSEISGSPRSPDPTDVSDNGTLTAQRYADEILRPHIIPYPAAIGNSFLLIQDNARSCTARLVENFLEAETIQCM